MDDQTRDTLRAVYHLIRAGQPEEARALLKPVLAQQPHEIDAWWLAVHAATHPKDKRLALLRVLKLKPDHGPAQQMLEQLNAEDKRTLDKMALSRVKKASKHSRQRHPDSLTALPMVRNRWVWNVIILLGMLSMSFASLVLVSGVIGTPFLSDTVDSVADAIGLDDDPQQGAFGTVPGGPVNDPYDIPITERRGATLGTGENSINADLLERDEAHVYTFNARRGQEVNALLQFAVVGDARYTLYLRDAGFKLLKRGSGKTDSGTVTLTYQFQRDGQYALIIIGRPNGPRGNYLLGVDVSG